MLTVIYQKTEQNHYADRKELERLILATADGEKKALSELYSRTRAAVYALCLSFLKNAHDAQDITQDVYVRIWDNAHLYQPHGSPMAWILTVARNLSRMKLRGNSKHIDLDDTEWNAIPADEDRISFEDKELLQWALSNLTDEERKIILLHSVSGLKHREIADLLELPLATVLSKYHRSLKKLKSYMKGDNTQ